MTPDLDSVRKAQQLLRSVLPRTRLVAAPSLGLRPGTEVLLKLETELPTASFKPRGALYALDMRLRQGAVVGVVAASTGNHGAAVAWAAKQLGVRATVFLPVNPNPVKRARIAALGANIVESGNDLGAASSAAAAFAAREGMYFLNDATDAAVPVGTATIACEILDERPDVEAIYVPMGDTALIRGISASAKQLAPQVRIVGVQAERAPAYCLSWRQGSVVTTASCDTIADGLATRTPEADNVRAICAQVDDVRLVSEQEMLAAMRRLILDEHVVGEPSGAAATAALLQKPEVASRVSVCLVTGANVTPELMRKALESR